MGGPRPFLWHIRVETPIALRSVAHRVSHHIPAESEMSRQNRATPPPNQGVAPFSGPPPRRTRFSFPAGRGRGGLVEGIAALSGSENGSRYRGVSQLQSHQSCDPPAQPQTPIPKTIKYTKSSSKVGFWGYGKSSPKVGQK